MIAFGNELRKQSPVSWGNGLSYMLKLGVDIIKIDKMFVDAIGTNRNSTTIVETLIDLAPNMRMDVVAEGVENFEQVIHLRERGPGRPRTSRSAPARSPRASPRRAASSSSRPRTPRSSRGSTCTPSAAC